MNNNISDSDLSVIRIALKDKLDDIKKYEQMAVELKTPLCEKFWADKRVIHEQLLERLYTYRTGLW